MSSSGTHPKPHSSEQPEQSDPSDRADHSDPASGDATRPGAPASAGELSYPRLAARTLRFSLGTPRNIIVSPDGDRVIFLRAPSGTDRRIELWTYQVDTGTERRLVDPAAMATDGEQLSVEERARRERLREGAAGIVGYAVDTDAAQAVFALSSQAWLVDLHSGATRRLPTTVPVLDPRLSPDGRYVTYASNGALRILNLDTDSDRPLLEPDGDNVSWGTAEFIAAEEMSRTRGYWWSPDSTGLLVQRTDESPVHTWYIADPASPQTAARPVRYPAAGTPNAEVSLWHVRTNGERTMIRWDQRSFPYLASVSWSNGAPLLLVLTRDQRTAHTLEVDPASGATTVVHEATDPAWVNILPGVPGRLPDGRLATLTDTAASTRLALDDVPVTPEGFQVNRVLELSPHGILLTGSYEPTEQHVALVTPKGETRLLTADTPGLHTATMNGDTIVISSTSLEHDGTRVRVLVGENEVGEIESRQLRPPFRPRVSLASLGDRELRSAVLFPRDPAMAAGRLPLLLDPYGGPSAQRVRASRAAFLGSQWFADQGFCVVVTDGRGTPNRGRDWERSIRDSFVSTLDDQVETIERIAERHPDHVDTNRVAIRGWSYGGYLAALAVLRRPDVFHAAVAGAPVTDWQLYDTCYTERYLGDPNEAPEVYRENSLLDLASTAPTMRYPNRPLLLIHGLADDNVVAAHTLRLSGALLAAGRQHRVLPLTGVTHMTPQEVVAENLLLLELDFLRTALR